MSRETISIIICIVFISIKAIWAEEPCTTSKCIHASATILQRIDNNVDPCDNFYDFACGAFVEQNYPADESVALDTFTLLKDSIQSEVFSHLNDDNSNENSTATFKLAKKFLQTCLERNGESGGDEVKTLKEIIQRLGGWPLLDGKSWDGANWTMDSTLTKLRRFLGHRADNIFDDASFVVNLENANNPSLRPSETFFSLRNAYFNYIKDLLNFLGASGEASQRDSELNQLLDFGSALGTINLKYQHLSESGDVKAQPDLHKTVLYLQWLDLFQPSQMKNIQINEADSVDEGSTFLKDMGKLLNATDPRTLANFVIYRVVDFAATQSISDLGNIYSKLRRLIDGQQDREQSWKVCIDELSANLPFVVGKVYIDKFFYPGTKASTQVMFDNIKDELVALITAADWIDKSARTVLLEKLESLVPLIAFPDGGFSEQAIIKFYADVNFDSNPRLETLLQLRVVDADNKFQQTYTSTGLKSSNSWEKYLPPTSVAASYSKSDNSIKFSAGILQSVGSGAHTINYLEYGATGFIIAHELGEQISHIVNQVLIGADPLSGEVRNNFTEKKKCLIEQYNQYEEAAIGLHLDGRRTSFENFADNMGIRLAYRAYREWNEKFTGKRQSLIGLQYTWDQLFWISAGQTWCGVYREEELRRKVISDSHATERFRVIGPLSNSPEFAKDFNCSPSAPMNRKNKCIIW